MTYIAYGIFSEAKNQNKRVGVKLADKVFDVATLSKLGVLSKNLEHVFNSETLNQLIEIPRSALEQVKAKLLQLNSDNSDNCIQNQQVVFSLSETTLHMPIQVAGYTDFYTSISHATNIGKIFRPDNPLMPNWRHLPVAYNGRASSIVVSGYPLKRPKGQILNPSLNLPEYKACQKLDFEVELGVIIRKHNPLGEPIAINDAEDYIFGVCILNDWSARDIQSWEYQPLGPFNSKGFLTSISPWIIPITELEDFKVSLTKQEPRPLDYLWKANDYVYDINFEVILKTPKCPDGAIISQPNFKTMYWSINQWIAHHTVSGTSLNPGDILGSGTISGSETNTFGSLMELTQNGKQAIVLPSGETRVFLEDGDELIIQAYCGKNHELDLGFVSTKIYANN